MRVVGPAVAQLADQTGVLVRILDAGRNLDRARVVVVQVAHLEGELVDVLGRRVNLVGKHRKVTRRLQSLPRGGGYHKEIEDPRLCDRVVEHGAGHGVGESALAVGDHLGLDPLVHHHQQHLDACSLLLPRESLPKLLQLLSEHHLLLALRRAVSVNQQLLGVNASCFFEGFERLGDYFFQALGYLLVLLLGHAGVPLSSAGLVDGCIECQDGLTARLVKDVVSADHSGLPHKRHVADGPRHSAHFGHDLHDDLVHDRAQILAASNRLRDDHLVGQRLVGYHVGLYLGVKRSVVFLSRHDEHSRVDVGVQVLVNLLLPAGEVSVVALDLKQLWRG